jgi:hypothetical protein
VVAEKYASRLVVPSGQQAPATRWSSHGDRAEKALAKLAAPHLPASLRALEQAVKRANRDYEHATQRATKAHHSKAPSDAPTGDADQRRDPDADDLNADLADADDLDANLADDEDLEPGE